MNTIKPALPQPKNLRWAAALNLFLPGAGLFYLGHRKTGTGLALGFLLCLMAALGIFVAGYIHYLSVISSDLMQEGQIEQLKDVFHKGWLVGLAVQSASRVHDRLGAGAALAAGRSAEGTDSSRRRVSESR